MPYISVPAVQSLHRPTQLVGWRYCLHAFGAGLLGGRGMGRAMVGWSIVLFCGGIGLIFPVLLVMWPMVPYAAAALWVASQPRSRLQQGILALCIGGATLAAVYYCWCWSVVVDTTRSPGAQVVPVRADWLTAAMWLYSLCCLVYLATATYLYRRKVRLL